MNSVCRDIFRAIHEGKWLSIEYKNKEEKITRYWIGILDLNVAKRSLRVEGLHLSKYSMEELPYIRIDSIQSSRIVEGSFCPVNEALKEDIMMNPHKYMSLFDNVANLKILNYLESCNHMDTTPYYSDFELVHYIDRDSFNGQAYQLTEDQFRTIVSAFQKKLEKGVKREGKLAIQQLAMNVLSIHTPRGLYVLAYKRLRLDIKNKQMRMDEEITVCTEYTIDGERKESIRSYLDAEEYELLSDFEKNQERIKDCITKHGRQGLEVDDMPYVIGLGMDVILDLHKEYKAIIDMYHEDNVTIPIKAFFGDLTDRPRRNKTWPITLLNQNINLDQLLAINNAMKYPLAYIQGPPGSGKTNTIINTIVTAFFNERTVLFSSYNNRPISGVFERLIGLEYQGKRIPFPVLRLGNNDKMREAIKYIQDLRARVKDVKIYADTLDKRKDSRIERAKQLSNLLKKYEDLLDLKERKDTINRMVDYQSTNDQSISIIPFQLDLQGRQLNMIKKMISDTGTITEEDAIKYLDTNWDEFYQYLYFTSAKQIQRLEEKRYEDLINILNEEDQDKQLKAFSEYFSKTENVKKIQRVFPIIITTCISAHKLGEPKPIFDMVIIDEASQCNVAVSLVPIIRGENLMLVGDPQQLSPVILLDELTNQRLKRKYGVTDEYDYRKSSIYKTYLACDSVSDEVLLHNHYRCHKSIIEFNNKKYYNDQLKICSSNDEKTPLVFVDVKNDCIDVRNTAPAEAEEIIKYAKMNKDKSIGVITPFVNQKKLIDEELKHENLTNVVCGTVHSFQGDEKDVILFSTTVTDKTQAGTYEWVKNNKELINVATSRARDKLIVLADSRNLERLSDRKDDDLYELVDYVKKNGESEVTKKHVNSRALGVKPFSTATEDAFLGNLSHALENIWLSENKHSVQKEVAISQVFENNTSYNDLFYTGRFDFVVYEKHGKVQIPVLAIELDGKEHYEDEVVRRRDRKKEEICRAHHLQLIRVENSYARRYNHIKSILENYFSIRH